MVKAKKILIFSTVYYPYMSGAEMAVDEISKKIDTIDTFDFDLITALRDRKLSKEEKYNNINIYRVGLGFKRLDKFFLPFLGYFKAKKLHKINNYFAIWSLMASQASIVASFLKMRFSGVKLLLTLQEGDEEEHLKRYMLGIEWLYRLLIRPWHTLVFKRADFITAISRYLKKRAERFSVKCPVEIVPNGVDLNKFIITNPELRIKELKNYLAIKDGEKIIVHTGRLNYKNAIDDVIRALKYLPDNVKFINVGGGSEKNELEKLAKDLGVRKRVTFINFLPHEEMVKYLYLADVFVRPSLSEGLGNSFLEAMATGLPVVATPVGGIPDFLRDGVTGWFCETGNPKSIAQKIEYILDSKNEAVIETVKKAALKLVQERYDWNKIAGDMRMIFEKL